MPRKNLTSSASKAGLANDRRPPALTNLQELVCDLAADLVVNGGRNADVSNLLRAAAGHSLHLRGRMRDGIAIEAEISYWLPRITRHWPAKTETEHPLPKTASEMARANVRDSLQSNFNFFLAEARVHELYLLNTIFQDFDSRGTGADSDCAESPFAEAFMLALGSDDTYVKVPRDRVEDVEQFLKTMDDDINTPAPTGRPKLLVFPPRQPEQEAPHAS